MDKPLRALPTHRRNNNGKEIDAKGFWRHERQLEYTLIKPPSCPTNRGRLRQPTLITSRFAEIAGFLPRAIEQSDGRRFQYPNTTFSRYLRYIPSRILAAMDTRYEHQGVRLS